MSWTCLIYNFCIFTFSKPFLSFVAASGMSLDSIYKSLNRTILYQLSRPLTSYNDLQGVADTLQKLLNNRILVFGPSNYDQEFVGCLCYCLLQICDLSPNNIR